MDKTWIHESDRTSSKYLQGVAEFLEFAIKSSRDGKLSCPCRNCANGHRLSKQVVFEHLLMHRFSPGYTHWYFHGESLVGAAGLHQFPSHHQSTEEENGANIQRNVQQFMEEMATGYAHIGEGSTFESNGEHFDMNNEQNNQSNNSLNEEARKFYKFLKETDEELFIGCKKHSRLSFILDLFHTKCLNGWSNKSFKELLDTLRQTLPEGDKLPQSSYEVKKLIGELGLGYEKIHACPNGCMLFWKDRVKDQVCLKCGASRWEESENKKKKAAKILRWFPLKPRLQRLFMCSKTASLMQWHFDGRTNDGNLRHPADARAWKEFDKRYEDFSAEPRNVRLGLASDGFNPFRTMSIAHSTWPVVLAVYNFPPWVCMKQPSLILSLLISGPYSPGQKIDVFLQPLIEELHDLWVNGIETYDAHEKGMFQMHAVLLWTISDFPAYSMLSGWSTKSRYACPSCGFDTCSKWLDKGKKFCFMGHRRFLRHNHPFRKDKRNFDGKQNHREAPIPPTGSDVLEQLSGNITIRGEDGNIIKWDDAWKKKSIFFTLPYWEYNLIRHNLDVMHIEKNVCDNFLGTLLNIEGKSKDNLKCRLDLQQMGIRSELHPIQQPDGKMFLPPSCYTMSTTEKDRMLTALKGLKVPDSYSSNISRCVKLKERKLVGLKSHDCHVLMQDLLPIVVKASLPDKVTQTIIDLCFYFRELCGKVLKTSHLEELEVQIGETLSRMEMIFPPSFFTIMVHLVVHLATEAKLAGPVHYRWMYPIERYLSTLKSSVRNRAHPEGSIAEWYIANESITHCSRYFEGVETRFNRPKRNDDEDVSLAPVQNAPLPIIPGHPIGAIDDVELDDIPLSQAHLYVLYNCDSIVSFIDEHRNVIKKQHRNQSRKRAYSELEIEKAHHSTFIEWFRSHVSRLSEFNSSRITEHVKWLAQGPQTAIRRFSGYNIRGVRYITKNREKGMKTQNSGVVVTTKTSYSKEDVVYYGVLNDIIELNYYGAFKVVLFKCDWIDVERGKGLQKDTLGFTKVNLSKLVHTGERINDEPYVLASQVQQVFYVKDPSQPNWHIVVRTKPRDIYEMGDELATNLDGENSFEADETMEECNEQVGVDWIRRDVAGISVENVVGEDDNTTDEEE